MLNKVMLIGNLGADPETRFTQDGTCVCNLRLATSEKFKNRAGEQQERTEWHRIVLWGRLGEIANQYLTKGSKVYIEGKIETRKWQDRDGNDQYTTEIRANEMKMLGGKASQDSSHSAPAGHGNNQDQGDFPSHGGGGQTDRNAKGGGNDPFANAPDFPEEDIDPDDIPF